MHQAARLIVAEALEAEASEALGRGYYEHGAAEPGYHNGYRTGKVKTAEGQIEFAGRGLYELPTGSTKGGQVTGVPLPNTTN